MSHALGFILSLAWYTPYADPPDGLPRVAAEMYVPCDYPGQGTKPTPKELEDLRQALIGKGLHYSLNSQALMPESRRLPPESVASARQKRMQRRIEKSAPLLADELIAKELAAKPSYYAGQTDPNLEAARDAVLAAEAERRQHLTSTPNQLHVYLPSWYNVRDSTG